MMQIETDFYLGVPQGATLGPQHLSNVVRFNAGIHRGGYFRLRIFVLEKIKRNGRACSVGRPRVLWHPLKIAVWCKECLGKYSPSLYFGTFSRLMAS